MSIQDLAKRAERISSRSASNDGPSSSGLHVYRAPEPTRIEAMIYDPIVCLIVQGEKQTTIGERTVVLGEGQCLVVGHDLPVLARITRASPRKPYLSLIIRLDLDALRLLGDELDDFDGELARTVGMSPSSFHRHFKSMTTTTPLQYQKDLRLTEARRLLRTGEKSVSSAAFEVGYESPSQFSREYSRKFGASPRADLRVA